MITFYDTNNNNFMLLFCVFPVFPFSLELGKQTRANVVAM